jgi:DNA-binding GntR family transcriptional regulator
MSLKKLTNGQTVEPTRSMADHIYESLRTGIVTGELSPGYRLLEKEVAAYFNASRTPVREAFRRLQQDYLVERVAQGGVKVAQFDYRTIHDLFNVRSVLEAYTIELACDRITPEQIAYLKQVRAQAMEVLNSTGLTNSYMLRRIFELNSLFHEKIYETSDSPFLIRILNNLRGIVHGLRVVSIQAEKSVTVAWEEHTALIGLLERKEKKAAIDLIKKHVASAAEQVISVMEKQGIGSPPDR